MKAKVLFTIMLLGILPCFAQKSFFGLTLGQTTFPQAKEILQKQNIPFNEGRNTAGHLYLGKETHILLSGFSWNTYSFSFDNDNVVYNATFRMYDVPNDDPKYRYLHLRNLLLSKYPDYKIVKDGFYEASYYWKFELEGEKLRITLTKEKGYKRMSLEYEHLKPLPLPPSDEL